MGATLRGVVFGLQSAAGVRRVALTFMVLLSLMVLAALFGEAFRDLLRAWR